MRLSCKASRIVLAASLALCLGMVPLAGCGSSSAPADDAATAEEEVVEEESAEEETVPEEEAVDESVWVKTSETYSYNPTTDEGGLSRSQTTTYTLDEAGNVIKETYSSEGSDDFVYDLVNDEYGWTLSMSSENNPDAEASEVNNEYDAAGRLVKSTSGESVTTHTYDADGNRIASDYVSVAYQMDEENNPIEETKHEIRSTLNYGSDGFITSRMIDWGSPQLSEMAYEYGDDGRPISCKVTISTLDDEGNKMDDHTQTQDVTFAYDENGNVACIETTTEYGVSTTDFEYTLIEHPSVAATVTSHLVEF